MGPLQILDMVGLNTAYNIDAPGNEEQRRFARFLKDNYIDKGKTRRRLRRRIRQQLANPQLRSRSA
jgi:3-hydroxyacyl-CoA dehydrogenase